MSITALLPFVGVVGTGSWHTVVLLGDGTLRAWGSNYDGQLGNGTTTNRSTSVQEVVTSCLLTGR